MITVFYTAIFCFCAIS